MPSFLVGARMCTVPTHGKTSFFAVTRMDPCKANREWTDHRQALRGEGCDEQTETLLQVFITHTQELQALGGRGEVGGDLGRFQQHSLRGRKSETEPK